MKKAYIHILGMIVIIFLANVPVAMADKCSELVSTEQYELAFSACEKAAKQGDISAQNIVGILYIDGKGVLQDYKTAVKWLLKAAKRGDVDSQETLALMYANGKGVPQNYKKAAKWFLKAAKQGNVFAQRTLGNMYKQGIGVTQEDEKAAKWFLVAAEQGSAYAQRKIGLMYWKGEGVSKSYKHAHKWILKAAKQEDIESQKLLGFMYAMGLGVVKDSQMANEWLQKAEKNKLSDTKTVLETNKGKYSDSNSFTGVYVNLANHSEYIELKEKGSFLLVESGMKVRGSYVVEGSVLKLNFIMFKKNYITQSILKDDTIKDEQGKVWTKKSTTTKGH